MVVSVADIGFHQRLGHMLDQLDAEHFWTTLAAFLRESVTFDSWVVMIFHPRQPPYVIYEGDSDLVEDTLFNDYVQSLYMLDPFYIFSCGNFTPGLYRLAEVAPEYFRETDYYRLYFAHNVVADEVQFLLPLPAHGVLSLSLGSRRPFGAGELGTLCLYTPWILPMLRAAVQRQSTGWNRPPNTAENLENRLRQSGTPHLTDREVQTALLLLAGHSTKTIATRMKISPETVKVHRRNLYEKLGVSTQAGIFARFMGSVENPPG